MFTRRNANQLEDDSHQDDKVSDLKSSIGPLSGHSLAFCSDATLTRYLDARNWNVEKAKQMIEETLKWRSTYKPHEILWSDVAHEGETGKISRASFHDKHGRTVLIMRPALQNTTSGEGNIRHLVYLLENAIINLPTGQEQISLLIDFTGWTIANRSPVKTTRETIHILQSHYPERLGISFFYDPPRLFQAVYKAVKYFLDPRTAQKVNFVYSKDQTSDELMRSHFDMVNLPKEFGGEATLEYDHEDFSRQMFEDDVKTAKFWGLEENQNSKTNGFTASHVVPEQATSLA